MIRQLLLPQNVQEEVSTLHLLLYGRYPKLGNLNLQTEYLSEIFDSLNICVNYESELFSHIRMLNVTYQPGLRESGGEPRMIGMNGTRISRRSHTNPDGVQ